MKTITQPVDIEAAIPEMVRRIVEKFHPEMIILFGSHARGDATSDSDVDFLVVMPVDGRKRDAAIDVRMELHGMGVAKDVVVTTPDDFAWRKDVAGTIEYPAVREGKVLYERA